MKGCILVFGGGPLQLSLIKRVKKLGYQAVVIDPDKNAPANKIADVFFQVEGNDYTNTLKIAKKHSVKAIVTTAVDKPILMMCRIAYVLGLHFPSYESCEIVLDKAKFKDFLKANNFNHAQGKLFKYFQDFSEHTFTFPVIIKPTMNSGSRGVIKCHDYKELQKALRLTLMYCNDGKYLIEEFLYGDEISVEALVQDHKVYILQITDKVITQPPYNVEIAHIQPSKYEYLRPMIYEILQKVVDKSGLNDCALHPELKINKDEITLIEIGPRLGGDYITSHLVPLSTGVNIEELLLNVAFGNKIDFKLQNNASMISYLNFPTGKIVKKLVTIKQMKNEFPAINTLNFKLKVGQKINKITNSLDRYGHFILTHKNALELHKVQKLINSKIEETIL